MMHFYEAGQGEPVIFLHGIPDTGAIWKDIVDVLQASHHCIVPDLPGFGRSPAPQNYVPDLETMAACMEEFINALGISTPVTLVVHDIGGPFGLAWAVRNPHRIKRLVIMNTVFHADFHWHRFARLCRLPLIGELIQLLTTQSGLAREMRSGAGSVKPSRTHIAAVFAQFPLSTRWTMMRHYRALDPALFAGWEDALRRLSASIPTLVLWGDLDPYIGQQFAERFGAGEVQHFPQTGHWPQQEQGAAVSSALQSFLKASS